jgi:DcaP outer membrane protein
VRKGLVAAVVVLLATGSANAQTTTTVAVTPPVPAAEKPSTGTPAAEQPAAEKPAAEKPEQQQTVVVAAESKPDGFTVGGFTFKPGGRIKLDIIRDFDPIGSEDSFDPRTIPVDGSEGTNSNIHAKETRLFLDIRGPVEGKELKMFVETDFYGSGSTLRLRHAYASYGGLLAGQTWSTFVDDNNFPNTIDFESPMAFPSIRQAQLRWTAKLGAHASWSAAVEDNKSTITPPPTPGKSEYPMPDLVTRVVFPGSRGHAFASAFLGRGRFRPATGEPDDVTLWGMLLSGRVKTFGKDYAYGQFTFGDGVGRYRGGTTAVPDASGELQPVGLTAIMGGYEHFWSDRVSSNVVFSQTGTPTKDYYPVDFNKDLDYGAVNLLYWFLKDRAWAGVEYLHGSREVFGDKDGSANRLQFAVRFNFPS